MMASEEREIVKTRVSRRAFAAGQERLACGFCECEWDKPECGYGVRLPV